MARTQALESIAAKMIARRFCQRAITEINQEQVSFSLGRPATEIELRAALPAILVDMSEAPASASEADELCTILAFAAIKTMDRAALAAAVMGHVERYIPKAVAWVVKHWDDE